MKCYLCAAAGRDEPAVAACPHCGAGLCFAHFAHPDLGHAGMHYGCGHIEEAARVKAARHPESVSRYEHRGLQGLFSHTSKG